MTRKEQIHSAYRQLGGSASFYDGMITCSTLPGKAVCGLVWNMDSEKNTRYLERALSGVPEDFAGKLLEVPVGTGVLTMPVYKELQEAEITCLDYSADMMGVARKRAEQAGIKNVTFRQGDVGALPFDDESFDIVLSLNGFHAFPDKEAAYRETFRVLNPAGPSAGASMCRAAANGPTGSSKNCTFPRASLRRRLRQRTASASGLRACMRRRKSQELRALPASAA